MAPRRRTADGPARRDRIGPRDRFRPDRDRPGLRVRLLGDPGLPGARRRGHPGRPGELEPGDDHDRPGRRRPDLHRTARARSGRGHHRTGATGRHPADDGRADGAQPRDGAFPLGRARRLRCGDDRRHGRGDRDGGGPGAVQGGDDRHRARGPGVGLRPLARGGARGRRRHRLPDDDPSVVHPRRRGHGDRGRPRRARAARRRRAGGEPDRRDPRRAFDRRLEGVRARGDAGPPGQLRRRLLDREPRRDGGPHRRLDHRRPRPDALGRRVPADARRRLRLHPPGGGGDWGFQHPVRRRPVERETARHRDEPAGVAILGARLQSDGVPDRQGRRPPRDRLHPRRDPQRHHEGDPGVLRADDRLRRDEGAALGLREASRRVGPTRHAHAVGRRGDGDRPHLRRVAAEGAARARTRTVRLELRPGGGARRPAGGATARPGVAADAGAHLRGRGGAAARRDGRGRRRGDRDRSVVPRPRRRDRRRAPPPRRAGRGARRTRGARAGRVAAAEACRLLGRGDRLASRARGVRRACRRASPPASR